MSVRVFGRASLVLLGFATGCSDDGGLATGEDPVMVGDCPCRLAARFESLALCVSPSTSFAPAHVYSSHWDASMNKAVCEPWRDPQPVPSAAWSKLEVSSACTGSGELCVTLKAGDSAAPGADDCELTRHCAQLAYPTAEQILPLASVPAWVAGSSCATRYEQRGGYLEFNVASTQLGCGTAEIERVPICPPRCETDKTGPGCDICGDGSLVTTF